MKRVRSIGLAIAAFVAMTAAASADSSLCSQLRTEYSSLQKRGPAADPQRQLRQATAAASRAGCLGGGFRSDWGGGFRPGGRGGAQCPMLLARINAIRQRSWGFFGGDYRNEWRRRELSTALRDNGCAIRTAPARDRGARGTGLFANRPGTFTTLCVRACDGYYFPISYAREGRRLAIDLSVCRALYPADEAELYLRRPDEASEEMLSLAGEPYVDKPFAFAYRSEYSPACATRLRAPGSYVASLPLLPSKVIAGVDRKGKARRKGLAMADVQMSWPEPKSLPPRLAQAVAARTGPMRPVASATTISPADGRPIRTIGPAYYYEDPLTIEALDLERIKRPLPPASQTCRSEYVSGFLRGYRRSWRIADRIKLAAVRSRAKPGRIIRQRRPPGRAHCARAALPSQPTRPRPGPCRHPRGRTPTPCARFRRCRVRAVRRPAATRPRPDRPRRRWLAPRRPRARNGRPRRG